MENIEKAKEIAQEHEKYTEDCRVNLHLEGKSKVDVARETAYFAAIDMAEWKDEQFKNEKQALIDNICEWLKKNSYKYAYIDAHCIIDFKQAMNEYRTYNLDR